MGEITNTGLQIPTVEELSTIQSEEQRADIDVTLANGSLTLIGNLNGIQSSHGREAWEAVQVLFDATDSDNAEGVLLDNICRLTGTRRDPASKSKFVGSKALTVNLSPGAQVTANVTAFAVAGSSPLIRFFATKTVKNETLIAADFPVEAASEFTGEVHANAGTVTVIATPTAGVNSVTNAFDVILGSDVEKDGPLRRRRETELRKTGSSNYAALEAALEAYTDDEGNTPVVFARVLNNATDFVDVNGIKRHSFLPIVWDRGLADDDALNAIVRKNSPAGILPTLGAPLLQAFRDGIDPGNSFARPVETAFTLSITIEPSATYAGDTALAEALAATALDVQSPVTEQGVDGEIAFSLYVASALAVGVKRVTSITITPGGGAPVVNGDAYPKLNQVATLTPGDVTIVAI